MNVTLNMRLSKRALFESSRIISKKVGIEKSLTKDSNKFGDILLQTVAEQKKIAITFAERKFFTQYIQVNHLLPIAKQTNDIELYKILTCFLFEVGQAFQMDFQEDNLLVDSLVMHIKKMSQGTMFQVSIEENLPVKFQSVLQEVETHIYILEKFLGTSLNQNIIYSIAIHICASMLRNQTFLPQLSVLIVCPGSMATGKLLEAQINNYFSLKICGVIAANRIFDELENRKNRIDFIISTVEVLNLDCPIVTVEPLLTLDDLKLIQQQMLLISEKKGNRYNVNRPRLMHKVDMLVMELNETLNELKKFPDMESEVLQLTQALFHYKQIQDPAAFQIQDLLRQQDILVCEKSLPWEEAIHRVGAIMENRCYSSAYIEKMIDNVKDYGPYIVISTGVAIAHASIEQDVWNEGLSLLVCRDGIEFEENK